MISNRLLRFPPEIARLVRCSSIALCYTAMEDEDNVAGVLSQLADATQQATGGALERVVWLYGLGAVLSTVPDRIRAFGNGFRVRRDFRGAEPCADVVMTKQDFDEGA